MRTCSSGRLPSHAPTHHGRVHQSERPITAASGARVTTELEGEPGPGFFSSKRKGSEQGRSENGSST